MPERALRNFGLSFSRRSARPNAGVAWRLRRAAAGITFVLVMILITVLWAMLAQASEDQMTAPGASSLKFCEMQMHLSAS